MNLIRKIEVAIAIVRANRDPKNGWRIAFMHGIWRLEEKYAPIEKLEDDELVVLYMVLSKSVPKESAISIHLNFKRLLWNEVTRRGYDIEVMEAL